MHLVLFAVLRLTGLLIKDYIPLVVTRLTLTHAPVYDSARQTELVFFLFVLFVFKAQMFAQRLINICSGIKRNACAFVGRSFGLQIF